MYLYLYAPCALNWLNERIERVSLSEVGFPYLKKISRSVECNQENSGGLSFLKVSFVLEKGTEVILITLGQTKMCYQDK